MRILLLLAIGLLLYVVFRQLWRNVQQDIAAKKKLAANKTVYCELCGISMIEKEAIKQGEHYFCSTDHLETYKS